MVRVVTGSVIADELFVIVRLPQRTVVVVHAPAKPSNVMLPNCDPEIVSVPPVTLNAALG